MATAQPALAGLGLTIESIKEAHAQRIAGASLKEQQEYISGEYKNLVSDFEKKYPSEVKIDTIDKWNEYKTDLINFKTQEKALGFYQVDEKTLINPVLDTANVPMYYKQVKQVKEKYGDTDWRVRGYQTVRILGDVGEAVTVGYLTAGTGIPEIVGAKLTYAIGATGSKIAGGLLLGGGVGLKGYSGYQSYKALGMSPWEGAIEGGISGAGEVAGFAIGASKGQLSPIKAPALKTTTPEGKEETLVRTFGIENPLAPKGKFYPVTTWEKGKGLSWGYGKGIDYGKLPSDLNVVQEGITSKGIRGYFQAHPSGLFTEQLQYEKGIETAKLLYDAKSQQVISKLDLKKSISYNEMNPEGQKAYESIVNSRLKESSGWKGFWNAGQKGVNKIYGSATTVSSESEAITKANILRKGTYNDFDWDFADTAMDKAQASVQALNQAGQLARNPAGTGTVEIWGKSGQWIKLEDLHGIDLPDLALRGFPLGYQPHPTRRMATEQFPESSVTKWKGLPASQLQDEAIAKISSIETPYSKGGQLIFSTTARRFPKDYYDIPMIAQGLTGGYAQAPMSVAETKLLQNLGVDIDTTKIGQLKTLMSVTSGIDWTKAVGKEVLWAGSAPSPSYSTLAGAYAISPKFGTTQSETFKRLTADITPFMPKGAPSASLKTFDTNWDVFMPTSKAPSPSTKIPSSIFSTGVSLTSPTVSKPSASSSYVSYSSIVSPSSPSVSYPSYPSPPSVSYPSYPSPVSPSVSYPSYPSPSSPSVSYSSISYTPQFVTPPPFPIPSLSGSGWAEPKEKARGRKRRGYTPDFTAKLLGIKMGKANQRQIDKLLEESFSGLEIRGEL
jgi:hypothetical protein